MGTGASKRENSSEKLQDKKTLLKVWFYFSKYVVLNQYGHEWEAL